MTSQVPQNGPLEKRCMCLHLRQNGQSQGLGTFLEIAPYLPFSLVHSPVNSIALNESRMDPSFKFTPNNQTSPLFRSDRVEIEQIPDSTNSSILCGELFCKLSLHAVDWLPYFIPSCGRRPIRSQSSLSASAAIAFDAENRGVTRARRASTAKVGSSTRASPFARFASKRLTSPAFFISANSSEAIRPGATRISRRRPIPVCRASSGKR